MVQTDRFKKLEVTSAEELGGWLLQNHLQEESIWLITFKKSQPEKYLSRWEVLDELICFGWIDGIRRKLDDHRTMQLISPRKVQHWARTYKERAAKLIENGKMHPSGMHCVEVSKANGLWNFMDDVDNLLVPDDLKSALTIDKKALDFFNAINDSSKRFVLRWLKLAKTDRTRQRELPDWWNFLQKEKS